MRSKNEDKDDSSAQTVAESFQATKAVVVIVLALAATRRGFGWRDNVRARM